MEKVIRANPRKSILRGLDMGKINVILSDALEKQFREEVFKRFGMKRGNMTKALEEAVKDWVKKKTETSK